MSAPMADHHKPDRRRRRKLIEPFMITHGRGFRLKQIDPDSTSGVGSKDEAVKWLNRDLERLRVLQDKLYARGTWAVLLVFQALDAAGKDSTIKHVMSGVNPQSCQVFSFKAPSSEELRHDFLWRTTKCLPERGHVGIFNRSYYEEVLVARVHPALLGAQRLPRELVTKAVWDERFEDIRAYERHIQRSGTIVLKFFLHVSKAEQRKRFLERLETPDKNWKFSASDIEERRFRRDYLRAYEETIRHTSAPYAPWFVVPADHKWFTRLIVSAAIVDALDRLDLSLPELTPDEQRKLKAAHTALVRNDV
jgi:PPK2 family polyphosphate:nucleotide phosphotransferase